MSHKSCDFLIGNIEINCCCANNSVICQVCHPDYKVKFWKPRERVKNSIEPVLPFTLQYPTTLGWLQNHTL